MIVEAVTVAADHQLQPIFLFSFNLKIFIAGNITVGILDWLLLCRALLFLFLFPLTGVAAIWLLLVPSATISSNSNEGIEPI